MIPPFSPSLLALATDPSRITPAALWQALSREDRTRALVSALNGKEGPWMREYLADLLAERRGGFRASTIRKWSREELAANIAKERLTKIGLVRGLLVDLHFPDRAYIQAAFFDDLGIAHENGQTEEILEEEIASEDEVRAAADRLISKYPDDKGLVYLLTIWCLRPQTWPGLESWLRQFADAHQTSDYKAAADAATQAGVRGQTPDTPACAPPAVPDVAELGEEASEPPEKPLAHDEPPIQRQIAATEEHLTPLDDLLTLSIVDSAAGVIGAPSPETLDVVLHELVRLNGRRHKSYHHLGLRDALATDAVSLELPAENANRWRWYLAGFIVGLKRRNKSAVIAQLYTDNEFVRGLGDTGLGPSAIAGPHIFGALAGAGRFAEASRFVTREALYHSTHFAQVVLDVGTGLLRNEEPTLARPLFDVLWLASADRKAEGLELPSDFWVAVRRRRAHCLRFADSEEVARPLLEELLAEPDLDNRAAVLADLGLMDAGYRRLFELKLPDDRNSCADLQLALHRGAPRFLEAVALGVELSSHGHYCLGFLALVEGRHADAAVHLEEALARFEGQPDIYSGGNLLARARLHLALAITLRLNDLLKLSKALRLLKEAMAAGERVPAWIAPDVLEALSLSDEGEALAVAEAILVQAGDGVLNAMAAIGVAQKSKPIADALLARFRSESRTTPDRVHDSHALLPLLRAQGRLDDAREVLDALEWAAHRDIRTADFLTLLADPTRYEPFWSIEDATWALVKCLECRRDYASAALHLAAEGHRVLSEQSFDALATASDILERLETYGSAGAADAESVKGRLEALTAGAEVAPSRHATLRPVTVLVVGGNEIQERYDDPIRAELEERFPHVQVRFLHSGWTSNWDAHLETMKRELPQVDGVLFLQFIRTEFGRSARRLCDGRPWRGIWGHGRRSIVNGILAVVDLISNAKT